MGSAQAKAQGHRSYRCKAHGDLGEVAAIFAKVEEGTLPCRCRRPAIMEKAGQLVCMNCAELLVGREYPIKQALRTLKLRSIDRVIAYRSVCNPFMPEN